VNIACIWHIVTETHYSSHVSRVTSQIRAARFQISLSLTTDCSLELNFPNIGR